MNIQEADEIFRKHFPNIHAFCIWVQGAVLWMCLLGSTEIVIADPYEGEIFVFPSIWKDRNHD